MSYMNALGVNRAYPAIVPLMVRHRQTRTQTQTRAPLPKPRKTNNAPLPFLYILHSFGGATCSGSAYFPTSWTVLMVSPDPSITLASYSFTYVVVDLS